MLGETAREVRAGVERDARGAEEWRRRFAAQEAVGGVAMVTRTEWDAVIGALREARAFVLPFVTGARTDRRAAWEDGRVVADKIARALEAVGEPVE